MEELDISRLKRRKPDWSTIKAPPSLFPEWRVHEKYMYGYAFGRILPSMGEPISEATKITQDSVLVISRGLELESDGWGGTWTTANGRELELELAVVWRDGSENIDHRYDHSVDQPGWYLESFFFFNWAGSFPLLSVEAGETASVLIRKAETRIGHFLSALGTDKPGLLPMKSFLEINHLLNRDETNYCDAATCVRVISNTLRNINPRRER